MTIITVASLKGGVGKTTTATALGSALAQFEDGVILVDFDSQGHVSLYYGLGNIPGVYRWLSGEFPFEDCLISGRPDGLRLLPGDSMTKALYSRYQGQTGAFEISRLLQRIAAPFVVVDTAAGGLLQEAAIMAADQIIIPFRPEKPSIDSLFAMIMICKELAPEAKLIALPTGYDIRISQHRMALAELRQHLPESYGVDDLYAIRSRAAVLEAWSAGLTIWEYQEPGIEVVRVGYAHLLGRVMANAGYDGSNQELMEALAYGKA